MHIAQCNTLFQCFSTGVPRNLRVPPMESKDSTNRIEKRELDDIYGHYRCIFWALSASKVHLRSRLHPKPRSPPDPLACCSLSENLLPTLGLRLQNSQCPQDIFWLHPWVPWESKLLQRVLFRRKAGKTLPYFNKVTNKSFSIYQAQLMPRSYYFLSQLHKAYLFQKLCKHIHYFWSNFA